NAVGAAEDGVEVVLELIEGEIFVDDLCHLEGRDDIESGSGDNAQASEGDSSAEDLVAIFFAGDVDNVAVGGNDLHRRDSGGEVAVFVTGAVCGGGTGSGDRDMRQRGEVVDSEALRVEIRSELPVGDAAADRDGASLGIDRH